jgi:hypothetical protein
MYGLMKGDSDRVRGASASPRVAHRPEELIPPLHERRGIQTMRYT